MKEQVHAGEQAECMDLIIKELIPEAKSKFMTIGAENR